MIEFAKISELLSVGGNTALIILLVLFWRFDRRLIKIEIIMADIMKERHVARQVKGE